MSAVRVLLGSLLTTILATTGFDATAQSIRARISLEEAQAAARQALDRHNTGAGLIPLERQIYPGFHVFEVVSDNPSASFHIATCAVNAATADVWDVAGHCHRLGSPGVRRIQAEIRARFHFPLREYRRLHAMKPSCDAD